MAPAPSLPPLAPDMPTPQRRLDLARATQSGEHAVKLALACHVCRNSCRAFTGVFVVNDMVLVFCMPVTQMQL
eukprot:10638183-Alexandrium_andersonii.AAC.1